jgi:hypothetical protein
VDLGEVRNKAGEAGIRIPEPLGGWIQSTAGSHRYAPLLAFRHAQIHRTMRQDARVVGGIDTFAIGTRAIGTSPTYVRYSVGADPANPPTHERGQLLADVAAFVPQRWQAFWPLVV